MQWIILGCLLIAAYWWVAYKVNPLDRRRWIANFFTAVVLIAVAGIFYEVVTTGTFAVTPQD